MLILTLGVAGNILTHPLLKSLDQVISDKEPIETRLAQLVSRTIEDFEKARALWTPAYDLQKWN